MLYKSFLFWGALLIFSISLFLTPRIFLLAGPSAHVIRITNAIFFLVSFVCLIYCGVRFNKEYQNLANQALQAIFQEYPVQDIQVKSFFVTPQYRWRSPPTPFDRAVEEMLRQCSVLKIKTNDAVPLAVTLYVWFFSIRVIEIKMMAPRNQSKILLKKLRSFNLRWGFFGFAGLLVPFLIISDYLKQKRIVFKKSSERREERGG
ncbi:MAG: hypothetical protein HQL18_00770 [Candidatus Omnitrophica bacterium]|nr:hypothetical protein [Candidatus Omnitrophota bacterium]